MNREKFEEYFVVPSISKILPILKPIKKDSLDDLIDALNLLIVGGYLFSNGFALNIVSASDYFYIARLIQHCYILPNQSQAQKREVKDSVMELNRKVLGWFEKNMPEDSIKRVKKVMSPHGVRSRRRFLVFLTRKQLGSDLEPSNLIIPLILKDKLSFGCIDTTAYRETIILPCELVKDRLLQELVGIDAATFETISKGITKKLSAKAKRIDKILGLNNKRP